MQLIPRLQNGRAVSDSTPGSSWIVKEEEASVEVDRNADYGLHDIVREVRRAGQKNDSNELEGAGHPSYL